MAVKSVDENLIDLSLGVFSVNIWVLLFLFHCSQSICNVYNLHIRNKLVSNSFDLI